MSHRIFIAGYVGFDNAGDEAIAQVLTAHLRGQFPDAEITFASGNPAQTEALYGVRAIGWRDPLAIVNAVRATDLTILGGGGLFQDYWGFDPAAILTREHWGLSFYLTPALLSAIYGKPLMLYAVGAGPLLSDHGRKYTKVAGDIAARITVRDLPSRHLFESLGVSPAKITVTADPAFDLAPAPPPDDLDEVREWKAGGPSIAVCLRTWNFGADSTFCDREVAAALDDVLAREGGRILFVPLGGGDDIYVARRVYQQMRRREQAAVLERTCPPAVYAGILARADLVLAMRLHSVIFSLAAQVPFLALEYDPKVGGLAELTGLQEFTMPFGGIEWDVLSRRMRQVLHDPERFRQFTDGLPIDLRGRARENAAIAAELLRQGSDVTDYGADARVLIGRLVMAQVTGFENLIDRFEACAGALGHSVAGMRPLAMADSVAAKVKEVQARIAELEAASSRLADAREESARLQREMEDARRESADARERADADRQQADARIAVLTNEVAARDRRLAGYEARSFGGIVKRALQVVLDTFQLLTPGPLRSAVRKYYLNWFYFRIYPERRT